MPRPRPALSGTTALLSGRRARSEEPLSQTDGAKARRAASAALARAMGGNWERFSECRVRDLDPELFFPAVGAPISAEALSACSACAVRLHCLKRAMRTEVSKSDAGPGRFGIYGGLTASQRTELAAGRKVRMLPASAWNKHRGRKVRAAPTVGTAASSGRKSGRSRAGSPATS